MNMLKIAALAAMLAAMTTGVSAATTVTVAPEECQALMVKADVNGDGSLAAEEAAPFAKAISDSEAKPANEGLLTAEEFMGFCQQGLFSEIAMQ